MTVRACEKQCQLDSGLLFLDCRWLGQCYASKAFASHRCGAHKIPEGTLHRYFGPIVLGRVRLLDSRLLDLCFLDSRLLDSCFLDSRLLDSRFPLGRGSSGRGSSGCGSPSRGSSGRGSSSRGSSGCRSPSRGSSGRGGAPTDVLVSRL